MRRKANTLVRLEIDILVAATEFVRSGAGEFHGYAMARALADEAGAKALTGHGTLYRALERLEKLGLLSSRWEDPAVAASEQRPLRRLYLITAEGEQAWQAQVALEGATAPPPTSRKPLKKGLAS
jgi:DNA-binding PadR family transcriptional regulator